METLFWPILPREAKPYVTIVTIITYLLKYMIHVDMSAEQKYEFQIIIKLNVITVLTESIDHIS